MEQNMQLSEEKNGWTLLFRDFEWSSSKFKYAVFLFHMFSKAVISRTSKEDKHKKWVTHHCGSWVYQGTSSLSRCPFWDWRLRSRAGHDYHHYQRLHTPDTQHIITLSLIYEDQKSDHSKLFISFFGQNFFNVIVLMLLINTFWAIIDELQPERVRVCLSRSKTDFYYLWS